MLDSGCIYRIAFKIGLGKELLGNGICLICSQAHLNAWHCVVSQASPNVVLKPSNHCQIVLVFPEPKWNHVLSRVFTLNCHSRWSPGLGVWEVGYDPLSTTLETQIKKKNSVLA